MSFAAYRERYLPLLESELKGALAAEGRMFPYYGMMQYHMGWLDEHLRPAHAPVGKQLRPLICLLVCEAVGGQVEHALPAAAAVELVHNFSLIHDDIEDDSPTRRHRPTLWKLWGLAQGVNCGDGMFAKAIVVLNDLHGRGVPPRRALDAQRILIETCLELTEGQYLDMMFETRQGAEVEEYLQMIRRKSAALIACSAHLGALLGGAVQATQEAFRRFGENLGMAFQVMDDVLGIWGQEEETGKSTVTDIMTRKKTLPIVYAMDDKDLEAIYAQDELTDQDVALVASILEARGARSFAEETARRYSEQAMGYLAQACEHTPASQAIRDLALSLVKRTF